ncbi:hypothetical protein [Luteimicrobium sp. DT211]|uniref:hypothetical protein n=1 Tax=Luteimicrobium sp. DT211 TaxID=3393412 RepID=UPI003CEB1EBF
MNSTDGGALVLADLVPRTSRRRRVAAVIVVVALLVAAWFSPELVRPRLVDMDDAAWAPEPGAIVETTVGAGAEAWPWLALDGVDDVPGARVVDASIEDETTGTPLDRIRSGDDAVLVVRWQVTDCDALSRRVRPAAHLRGALGTTTTQRLPAMAGPAFDLQALRSFGTCGGE